MAAPVGTADMEAPEVPVVTAAPPAPVGMAAITSTAAEAWAECDVRLGAHK